MAINTLDTLLDALPEPMAGRNVGTRVNEKIAEALLVYYSEWETAITQVGLARFDETATGYMLDQRLALYGYSQARNLSEAQKRLTLAAAKAKRWGGTTYDELLGLAARLLQVDPGDIEVRESMAASPSTAYEPAAVEFIVTSEGLIDAGVAIADIPATLAQLEADLDDAAPAGVKVRITLVTADVYGTGVYGEAIYGG